MLTIRRLLLPLLAIAVVVTVAMIHTGSREAQTLKFDLAEIDDVRYGLFDADVWVEHLLVAMDRRIESFGDEPVDRAEVQAVFEATINHLIGEVERAIRVQNEERPLGSLRQLATDFVIDFDDLRSRSGEFAEMAMVELERPENRERLKSFLRERVDSFADSTFARTDRAPLEAVLERHECGDRDTCRAELATRLGARSDALFGLTLLAIVLVAVTIATSAWPAHRFGSVELGAVLVGTFALLFGGLFTPMIDIEAEIARLELVLAGEPIVFADQVLFFQSKSIVDVVSLLIDTGRIDLVLVGLGIGLFSVVFPVAKLGATVAYRYGKKIAGWRPVRFFALESAKWSMADVFVIAMFLAYLGFDGLTGSQLATLLGDSSSLAAVDTYNGTRLQPGFHLFAAFCLAGLVLSGLVKRAAQSEKGQRQEVRRE